MTSRFKYLFLALFLLTAVTVFIYMRKSGKSSMADNSRDFAIEKVEDIGKIFVTDRNGAGYTLEKRGDTWYADSIHLADPAFVDVVLTTLKRMTVTNLVPKPAIKNVMKDIATLGKKVEVYDRSGDKIKSFYIGGPNQRVTASYMVLDGYNIPYEMSYPGFSGDLGGRLWPLHLIDVRSKSLFKYKAGEIKKITVTYPRDKNESFQLQILGLNKYKVDPLSPTVKPITKEISKGAVEEYLSGFENILAAKVLSKNMLNADTLISNIPFAQIEIVDKNDAIKKVDLYPVIEDKVRMGLGYEPEYYFVIVDNKSYFNAQNLLLKKIFRGYSYFYE